MIKSEVDCLEVLCCSKYTSISEVENLTGTYASSSLRVLEVSGFADSVDHLKYRLTGKGIIRKMENRNIYKP